MDATQRMERALHGARNQYRAMFHTMAAMGGAWHYHVGSAGYVLLQEGAAMDVPLPIILHHVQTLTEAQVIARLREDAFRREFAQHPAPATANAEASAGALGARTQHEGMSISDNYTAGRWVRNAWHDGRIVDVDGRYIATAGTTADAARIVACVNGWDALAAERDALRAALQAIADAEPAGDAGAMGDGWKVAHAKLCGYARASLTGKGDAS